MAATSSSPRPFGLAKTIVMKAIAIGGTFATSQTSSMPTITMGAGAPSASEANGSIYLRADGSNGDDSLYMRIGGSWVAMQCQTA